MTVEIKKFQKMLEAEITKARDNKRIPADVVQEIAMNNAFNNYVASIQDNFANEDEAWDHAEEVLKEALA